MQGASAAIDTACSSSLTAAHFASLSLARGESPLALVGGVNLTLSVVSTVMCARAGMLSPEGRCKTLDAAADGYVRSEAVRVIYVQAGGSAAGKFLLHSTAVNQDGRSSSLTAPNGPAQQAVMRAALRDAGLRGEDMGALQLHGTGTALGDPIEMGAIYAVQLRSRERVSPPSISSIKSFVGHAEACAGLSGLLNAALGLSRQVRVPLLHLRAMNPHVVALWEDARLAVARLAAGHPSMGRSLGSSAGVSSFAFQGTNAHAIVSTRGGVCPEYDSAASRATFRGRHWFAPECHPLLRSASAEDGGAAALEIRVASVASSLFDHRVLGRALFPGAGYLETVLAASRSLLGDGEPCLVAATAASIPVPMYLPELDPQLGGLSEATASLRLRADRFEAATLSGGGRRLVHALGSVGFVFLPVEPTDNRSPAVVGSLDWCCTADGKTGAPFSPRNCVLRSLSV